MATDTRVLEMEALAIEEGFRLPMPAELIVWLEDRGFVVDFATGMAYDIAIASVTPAGRSVNYLLQPLDGELQSIIDHGEDTEEYEDWLEDEEWMRRGC